MGVLVLSIVSLEKSRGAAEAANREVEKSLAVAGAKLRFFNRNLERDMARKRWWERGVQNLENGDVKKDVKRRKEKKKKKAEVINKYKIWSVVKISPTIQ